MLLSACQDPEKGKLDNRVIDYWNLKINKDYKKSYQFLSPGWRSNEAELPYMQRMLMTRVKWLSVKLIDKVCTQKDLCEVKIEMEYEYQFRGSFGDKMKVSAEIKENWIMRNNIWYTVPSERKL